MLKKYFTQPIVRLIFFFSYIAHIYISLIFHISYRHFFICEITLHTTVISHAKSLPVVMSGWP